LFGIELLIIKLAVASVNIANGIDNLFTSLESGSLNSFEVLSHLYGTFDRFDILHLLYILMILSQGYLIVTEHIIAKHQLFIT
jgi:hypothetical protein